MDVVIFIYVTLFLFGGVFITSGHKDRVGRRAFIRLEGMLGPDLFIWL